MTGDTVTSVVPNLTLEDVIGKQLMRSPNGYYEFVCRRCRNWRGGVNCVLGYFVSAEGVNTSDCASFVEERRK